jgi:glycosyltransferase involved in cell wall biosynthesis
MMSASIVICTYNRGESLQETLENLDHGLIVPNTPLEIIVVDNNSSDNTRDLVNQHLRKARIETRYIFEKRQGKSYALNRGVNEAKGDIVCFTDDDVLVRRDWIINIMKVFDETGCACVGGKILLRLGKTRPEWLGDKMMEQFGLLDLGNDLLFLKTPKLYGANIAVRKSVFRDHGYFDVNLGPKAEKMHDSEDISFINKLIRGGEKVLYSPDVVIEHVVPAKHIEKSYFRKRAFYQAELKGMNEVSAEGRNIFGIPLYMLREAITTAMEIMYLRFVSPVISFQKEMLLVDRIGFMAGRIKQKRPCVS